MPQADKRIRVMAADDHPLLREGIAAVIGEQEDMVMVAEAASGREAIEGFRDHRPYILFDGSANARSGWRRSHRGNPKGVSPSPDHCPDYL